MAVMWKPGGLSGTELRLWLWRGGGSAEPVHDRSPQSLIAHAFYDDHIHSLRIEVSQAGKQATGIVRYTPTDLFDDHCRRHFHACEPMHQASNAVVATARCFNSPLEGFGQGVLD
jgi:hypothetical protein